jgi:hypothetical protein
LEGIGKVDYKTPGYWKKEVLFTIAILFFASFGRMFLGVLNLLVILALAFVYWLDRKQTGGPRLFVNGQVVHAGKRLRYDFWKDVLQALAFSTKKLAELGEQGPLNSPERPVVRLNGDQKLDGISSEEPSVLPISDGRAKHEPRKWLSTDSPRITECEQCSFKYIKTERDSSMMAGINQTPLNRGELEILSSANDQARYKELRSYKDMVPCPDCGFCPPAMVARARRMRRRWMDMTAVALMPIGFLIGIVSYVVTLDYNQRPSPDGLRHVIIGWTLVGMAIVLIISLPLLRCLSCRRWDPNHFDVKIRQLLGKKRTERDAAYFGA